MTRKPGWPDRAAGVLLAAAAGDALGAGYEFTHPRPEVAIGMIGGGPFDWAPGEWTDDTAMTLAVARVTATGADLNTTAGLDAVAAGFASGTPPAPRTSATRPARCLSARDTTAAAMTDTARRITGRKGGNGSLMRTGRRRPGLPGRRRRAARAPPPGSAHSPTTTSGPSRPASSGRTRSDTRCCTAPSTASAATWTGSAARPRILGAAAGPGGNRPPEDFAEQRLGGARAADRLVGDHPRRPCRRRPAPGRRARARGPGRRRHRHHRRDRRRAARRPLGCVRGARRLASAAARLAGHERPRPGPAGRPHRLPRSGRPARLAVRSTGWTTTSWATQHGPVRHPHDDGVWLGGYDAAFTGVRTTR